MWTAIGLAIGTYLNWKFVAKRLRKYSEVANNSITVPDFFSNRFHDNKHVLMTIAAIITLVFFSIYTGSCFVTCGKLFSTLFGLDYATMMVLGAIIVFLYTFVGGYLSVCTTDLIQGTLMFFALATVFIGSVAQAGGVENTVAFLQDIPGYLSGTQIATPILDAAGNQVVENRRTAVRSSREYGLITIVSGLAWGLGYFGMPQVLVRFMSVRHSDEIKKSRIIAMIWLVVSLSSAVCIGLIGRAVIPTEFLTQSAAENVFVVLSRMILPSFACGLVVSGIFAAADELLVFLSAHFRLGGRNEHLQGPDQARRDRSPGYDCRPFHLGGRSSVRHHHRDGFQLVHLQRRVLRMAGFGASFGPLVLFSLYWKRTTLQGGIAGMLVGAASVFAWHNLVKPLGGWFGVYELLPAFVVRLHRHRGGLAAHEKAFRGNREGIRYLHGSRRVASLQYQLSETAPVQTAGRFCL